MTLTIGLVAGEASGDNLAAGLMAALKSHQAMSGGIRFLGVGGPAMIAQGLEPLASIDELSVNGFKEPILRLPQLWKLYRRLASTFQRAGSKTAAYPPRIMSVRQSTPGVVAAPNESRVLLT